MTSETLYQVLSLSQMLHGPPHAQAAPTCRTINVVLSECQEQPSHTLLGFLTVHSALKLPVTQPPVKGGRLSPPFFVLTPCKQHIQRGVRPPTLPLQFHFPIPFLLAMGPGPHLLRCMAARHGHSSLSLPSQVFGHPLLFALTPTANS